MLNQVQIVGRLWKDPEVEMVGQSHRKVRLPLVWNEKVISARDGESGEHKAFVYPEFWNRTADFIERHAEKGTMVFVEAELRTESWEKDGERKNFLRMVGKKFRVLSGWREKAEDDDSDDLPF
ncbi:hypothetical protein FUAX_56020 (plasmid) [Fulvitalea axinellae]|uniref:Single-stranded DNA-binding protein n=1 Tax=Fulvitalea axinellae TaxID=1182444 RepID=A0AAU9DKY9_9BACT|nr:hypothetical protein FUAX_56020 [Fulvitalea axinellae]